MCMKYFLFTVTTSLLGICISCNESSTISAKEKGNSQAQRNLDAWHVVSMAFATGDQNVIDTVIADDYLDHTSR